MSFTFNPKQYQDGSHDAGKKQVRNQEVLTDELYYRDAGVSTKRKAQEIAVSTFLFWRQISLIQKTWRPTLK